MLISIIIPLYRGRDVIGACLDSLYTGHDDCRLEIIVIDDASPDYAGDFVRSNYHGVQLLSNNRNLGYAAAVNRGIAVSTGDLILFLNQDTVVQPGAIEILADELAKDRNLAAAAPQLLNQDRSIQRSCRNLPSYADIIYHHLLLSYLFPKSTTFSKWKMGRFSHDASAFVEQPAFSAIMLKRETVELIGFLDERFRLFFNDVDYCRRIADSGMMIRFCPNAKVIHQRGQSTGQIPLKKIFRSHLGFIRYFFKHERGVARTTANVLIAILLTLSGVLRIMLQLLQRPFISKGSSS